MRRDRASSAQPTIPVVDALHDLDEQFLICRDVHHAWTVTSYSTSSRDVMRVLVCTRCGTERVDAWTLAGMRVGSRYHYADGYQFRHVEDATDRTAMRREVLRRAGYGTTTARRRGRPAARLGEEQ